MDYSALVEQFLEYFPEFSSINVNDLNKIESAIKRALVFIKVTVYGEFFYEALYTQVAIFLYSSNLIFQNKDGFVASRTVQGEYSVSYALTTNFDGKYFNPYQQQLDDINSRIGLGLGMILDL